MGKRSELQGQGIVLLLEQPQPPYHVLRGHSHEIRHLEEKELLREGEKAKTVIF